LNKTKQKQRQKILDAVTVTYLVVSELQVYVRLPEHYPAQAILARRKDLLKDHRIAADKSSRRPQGVRHVDGYFTAGKWLAIVEVSTSGAYRGLNQR
jgi:hypothetical protein